MQKRLGNKLSMYKAINLALNNKKALWEDFPALKRAIEAFKALIVEIDKLDVYTAGSKKGVALGKKLQREKIIDLTMELATMLCALEAQTPEKTIRTRIDYSRTDLVKKRDFDLEIACSQIATVATNEKERLSLCGIDESEIETLKQEIDLFAEYVPAVRRAIADRKVANEKLQNLFAQADELLRNQLDRLMTRYQKTDLDFYNFYKISRHVINYGVRHKKKKSEEETSPEGNAGQEGLE
jgi:hypothetical protein